MSPSAAPNAAANEAAGKCPVDHKNASLWRVLGIQHKPTAGAEKDTTKSTKEQEDLIQRNQPASLEEAAKHAQTPHPTQRLPLSTHRAESTIPRGEDADGTTPHHQMGAKTNKWVYPSEQQVFNAMKRKGWEGVEEESIPSFLQIHNSVNERSWRILQQWEPNPNLQLVRFEGRPKDLTPKAWIWSNLLMQDPPFDRHDWYIDNGVETDKRYVLDFYMQEDASTGLPRVDIDVRPALDTPQAFVARGQRLLMDLFPGITKEVQRFQATRNQPSS